MKQQLKAAMEESIVAETTAETVTELEEIPKPRPRRVSSPRSPSYIRNLVKSMIPPSNNRMSAPQRRQGCADVAGGGFNVQVRTVHV